jgi:hypothetical protein
MIEVLLNKYIQDTKNTLNIFKLALEYERIGQTSSAISYYLECAEYSDNEDLSYECLLRISKCYGTQDDRREHTFANLEWAIDLKPERIEAYGLLSQFHEYSNNWKKCMLYARLGMIHCEKSKLISNDIEFEKYHLEFEYALSLWNLGLFKKSISIFERMSKYTNMSTKYMALVSNNLKNLKNLI